jgi:hypothetical protein
MLILIYLCAILGSHCGEYEDGSLLGCIAVLSHENRQIFTASIIRAIIALIMNAIGTSETSVYFHDTTWHYIPENCHIYLYFGILGWKYIIDSNFSVSNTNETMT